MKNRKNGWVVSQDELGQWIRSLLHRYTVTAPVLKKGGQTVFETIDTPDQIHLAYASTMIAPTAFIYPPRQDLFEIDRPSGHPVVLDSPPAGNTLIFGIHPCDMHALTILDRVLNSDFVDPYYKKARTETITVVLNCTQACQHGFCASMGAGPFLTIDNGFDVEVTPLKGGRDGYSLFLLEPGSPKGNALIEQAGSKRPADKDSRDAKRQTEAKARATLTRSLNTDGLPAILADTLGHPIYKAVARTRCLGCTNCTMVCPTCYCYNLEDDSSFDLRTTLRKRRWDSCQELNFATVHGGNFRASREARLRQFITHKLGTWVEQYNCFGCVGCGRCIRWCPTGIDLVEIATQIRNEYRRRTGSHEREWEQPTGHNASNGCG